MTTRLTGAERKHFTTRATPGLPCSSREMWGVEPAMGTLDERLDILIRRFGGTTGRIILTADEQAELRRCTVSL